jgi:hypothetical protein
MRSWFVAALFGLSCLASRPGQAATLAETLASLAPEADGALLERALSARDCAVARGLADAGERLAVIDYARPSTEPRLWVFDLQGPSLLFVEHVAHGRGSGENLAQRFSNREGSHQSSLGLFRTGETYDGGNGYSLRLDGLEPGLNDRARERAIVMHGAAYVDPLQALRQGRLGRSFGCPAVRTAVARPLIDAIKQGQLLYADAGTAAETSALAECRRDSVAGAGAQRQAAATRP